MRENMMAIVSCGECGKRVSEQAASCPDCGYPMPAVASRCYTYEPPDPHTSSREYKLMLALGMGVTSVGVLALMANSLLAAILAIAIGIGTSLSAALGLWRNTIGN